MAKTRNPVKWKLVERQKLELLLKEGNTITHISKIMNLSGHNIRVEMKRGLSEEAFLKGKKTLYNHKLAIITEIKECIGEEQFEYIKEDLYEC